MNTTLILIELASYSFKLRVNDPVNKTHLLVQFDFFQCCLELSVDYRFEMLRRKNEKYFMNPDWLFEWHPAMQPNDLCIDADLTSYDWHFGDPGVWLIGKYLRHYDAIPSVERTVFHIAFRSTTDVEVAFGAIAEYLFYNSRKGVSSRTKVMSRNRVVYLFARIENYYPLS